MLLDNIMLSDNILLSTEDILLLVYCKLLLDYLLLNKNCYLMLSDNNVL
jgi:hypothetical protein